jgi:hypothetical protein
VKRLHQYYPNYNQTFSTINTMGRGKDWRALELVLLARAWVSASNNATLGIGMRSSQFWNDVHDKFIQLSPVDHEQGLFKDRAVGTLKNYWNDHLHPQANKFQLCYTKVLAMELTGNLTEDQKINIAVAYYIGAINKPTYDYRDFDSKKHWKCFSAWYEVMRHQPKWSRMEAANPGVAELGGRVAALPPAGSVVVPPLVPILPFGFVPPPATGGTAASVAATDALEVEVASSVSGADDWSLAPGDPMSASSRKRGHEGRGKTKAATKKEKKEEQKAEYQSQASKYMVDMVKIAQKQADTTGELKEIMNKELQLEQRKQKINECKTAMKFAQAIEDDVMFERAKEELKNLLNLDQPIGGRRRRPT